MLVNLVHLNHLPHQVLTTGPLVTTRRRTTTRALARQLAALHSTTWHVENIEGIDGESIVVKGW
jgi:hypothetical protein